MRNKLEGKTVTGWPSSRTDLKNPGGEQRKAESIRRRPGFHVWNWVGGGRRREAALDEQQG